MPERPLDDHAPSPPRAKTNLGPLALGGFILLLAYPFCLLANVMSFAAPPNPATAARRMLRIASKAFLWTSTLYPLVYLAAAAISLLLSSNDRPQAARRAAQVPLIYLAIVLLLLLAWAVVV